MTSFFVHAAGARISKNGCCLNMLSCGLGQSPWPASRWRKSWRQTVAQQKFRLGGVLLFEGCVSSTDYGSEPASVLGPLEGHWVILGLFKRLRDRNQERCPPVDGFQHEFWDWLSRRERAFTYIVTLQPNLLLQICKSSVCLSVSIKHAACGYVAFRIEACALVIPLIYPTQHVYTHVWACAQAFTWALTGDDACGRVFSKTQKQICRMNIWWEWFHYRSKHLMNIFMRITSMFFNLCVHPSTASFPTANCV